MMKKHKNDQSRLSQMKLGLAQLKRNYAKAGSLDEKAKFGLRIILLEQKIKREEFHKVSGFSRISVSEIHAGAPGMGKRA